jgi:hypothetical protein
MGTATRGTWTEVQGDEARCSECVSEVGEWVRNDEDQGGGSPY